MAGNMPAALRRNDAEVDVLLLVTKRLFADAAACNRRAAMGREPPDKPGRQRMTITITQYGDSSNVLNTPTTFFAFGTALVGTASAPLDPGQYTNIIFGDYQGLTGFAVGGRDTLTGGELSFNTLYGDAFFISGHAIGNGDLLVAGDNGSIFRLTTK